MVNPQRSASLAHPPFDAVADIGKYAILRDDFVGGTTTSGTIGDLGWIVTSVAGSADSDVDLVATAAVVQGHPGVISLNSGPTTPAANDEGSLFLTNVDAIVLPDDADDHVYVAALVRFPSIASVEFNFGLFDAADAAQRGANSVCVEFDASASAYFQGVAVDGSTATATSSTAVTVAADTWYLLEIAAHEDEVQFYANGTLIGAVTGANIPDDEPLGPGFKVTTEAAAEKSVLIDAFILRVPVSRGY